MAFGKYAYDSIGNGVERQDESGTYSFVYDGDRQQVRGTSPDRGASRMESAPLARDLTP